jgi:hypothetical protein
LFKQRKYPEAIVKFDAAYAEFVQIGDISRAAECYEHLNKARNVKDKVNSTFKTKLISSWNGWKSRLF